MIEVVVAIEVNLVRRAAHFVTLQQLLREIGKTGRRGKRDVEILVTLDAV